ncbi:hypothetical protein K2173_027306 [Erythroxylum novogranatense]|uniref:Uncharacterized protein n=1 Tax=Erythroxylum novogranatense TaxID=1862640 RepID=A0AAV8U1H2_9ROSI|nr:hypothetical protein K2173_027306 [Erythroxylum novogranatense]
MVREVTRLGGSRFSELAEKEGQAQGAAEVALPRQFPALKAGHPSPSNPKYFPDSHISTGPVFKSTGPKAKAKARAPKGKGPQDKHIVVELSSHTKMLCDGPTLGEPFRSALAGHNPMEGIETQSGSCPQTAPNPPHNDSSTDDLAHGPHIVETQDARHLNEDTVQLVSTVALPAAIAGDEVRTRESFRRLIGSPARPGDCSWPSNYCASSPPAKHR